jgi:hypothetical protein
MMESQLRVMMESVLRVMMEPATTHARNGPPKCRVMIVFGTQNGELAPSAFPLFFLFVCGVGIWRSACLLVQSVCLLPLLFVCFFFFFHQFARETGGRVRESLLLLLWWLFCSFFPLLCLMKVFPESKATKGREEKGRKEGRLVENTSSFSCPFSLHRSLLLPSGFGDSFLSHPFLVSFFLLIPSFLPSSPIPLESFFLAFLDTSDGVAGRRRRRKENQEETRTGKQRGGRVETKQGSSKKANAPKLAGWVVEFCSR